MTDFEAMSYQGNRNRGNVLDDTEGDYDEEQDEERESSPRQRHRCPETCPLGFSGSKRQRPAQRSERWGRERSLLGRCRGVGPRARCSHGGTTTEALRRSRCRACASTTGW